MVNKSNLIVKYNDRRVGKLALYERYLTAFEYDRAWLSNGFSISPLSLPLEPGVLVPQITPFDGIFGVFSDSLPDGWGHLLVDRMLRQKGIDPYQMTPLDRLAIVGSSGMGALTYEPEERFDSSINTLDLDTLAEECRNILEDNTSKDLDQLFSLGGSSGGARPKILTTVDNEDWIIKFPASMDEKNIGEQEFDYASCARKCGIAMEKVKLFPSQKTTGYFGTRRFDRKNKGERIHMVSVSGLLESSHRMPSLDYNTLMKLTLTLTNDFKEVEKLYRLMCFNVFAHNRDDHSKNFAFLYDEQGAKWSLSPAYDLTYSSSIGGEHATMVNGNGLNPGKNDALAVAESIGLNMKFATEVADEISEIVHDDLCKYNDKHINEATK
jgi:serine/threonine-protein kinase HipA